MEPLSRERLRLGVVGTGGIGRVHIARAEALPEVSLCVLCGLDPAASALAAELDVPLVADYREVLDYDVDAVVVAVPNQLHLEIGGFFVDHGVGVLMEKPIADTVEAGAELCRRAEATSTPLLIGHHRRYNNLVRSAAAVVSENIGELVATNTMVTLRKPDSYYEPEWRRSAGAGPLLVNLIHEVDLQRFVAGEITAVQAMATDRNRGFAFDDTAVVLLRFTNGALGTMVISESTPSPWSWEASVSEGMGFHNAGRDSTRFLGTEGSLSFPSLTIWRYDAADGEPGWRSPLHAHRHDSEHNDPYAEQLRHLARAVRDGEEPVVSGREGLRSLAVVAAVTLAARSDQSVVIDDLLDGP